MPSIFGIPLIGFIQIVIGVAVVSFVLIKYILRPKKRREGQYIINDAHIIVGDGSELNHQYVYIKDGIIKEISCAFFEHGYEHCKSVIIKSVAHSARIAETARTD